MLGYLNTLIGIVSVTVVVILILKKCKERKKRTVYETNADGTYTMGVISGEVMTIEFCEDTGLSKITVRDTKGKINYGFSKISVKELNMLYAGKGYVQIPIIVEKQVKGNI